MQSLSEEIAPTETATRSGQIMLEDFLIKRGEERASCNIPTTASTDELCRIATG